MIARLKGAADPYILALLGTVLLASLLPARGGFASLMGTFANGCIVLLFFLHGAKLPREAVLAAAGHWRLHATVLATSFGLFPLLGYGIARLPFLPPMVATGLLFLTLLPSTVQSSIAFTAIARGNVAAAVCAASFSNLLGIFITPLLVASLLGGGGAGMSFDSVEKILLQLLAPFLIGHLARPWIGGLVARHKFVSTLVDRGSILLVVYTAFSAAVVEGLWHKVPVQLVGLIALLCAILLVAVLAITLLLGRVFGFARADAIVLLFCGSKKSLASGVPMAGVLFPAAQVGVVILPLMLFHQLQLIACAVIARNYAEDGRVD